MALEDLKQQKYEQNLAWGTFIEIQSEFGLGDLHGVIFGVCFGVKCPKSTAQSSSKGREQLLLELPSSSHSTGRGAPNSGSARLNSHLALAALVFTGFTGDVGGPSVPPALLRVYPPLHCSAGWGQLKEAGGWIYTLALLYPVLPKVRHGP